MTTPSAPEDAAGSPSTSVWKVVMGASSASVDQVFVLRFWRETQDSDQADTGWRVKISHVNSRQRLHAQGLDRAFEVLRSALETSLDNPPKAQR
jgi:hypothetical protein